MTQVAERTSTTVTLNVPHVNEIATKRPRPAMPAELLEQVYGNTLEWRDCVLYWIPQEVVAQYDPKDVGYYSYAVVSGWNEKTGQPILDWTMYTPPEFDRHFTEEELVALEARYEQLLAEARGIVAIR